jgi:hypothetical protein
MIAICEWFLVFSIVHYRKHPGGLGYMDLLISRHHTEFGRIAGRKA